MGSWIDILRLGASGDSQRAREVLYFHLTLTLRYPASWSAEDLQYKGPLSDAVGAFISKLPQSELPMADSRKTDFVDYILENVIAGIERTLLLVEFCHAHAEMTLDEIATNFPGWAGLKRSVEQKKEWVADMLRSMLARGVTLPQSMVSELEDKGEPKYEFNEIAYVKKWDMGLAWNDFKKQQELDYHYSCIDDSDSDEDPGVAAEGIDYGLVTMADILLREGKKPDNETQLDFFRIGQELSPALTGLMEEMHTAKPTDGYRPIAWHNVFWNIPSEYEALPIRVETRDPLCDSDQKLADHIAHNYLDVVKPNRLNIFRRRDALYKACKKKVLDRLQAWMNKTARGSHL